MEKALQAQLATVGDEVSAAALSSDCKSIVAWCMEKLPDLYAKLRETNESRYIEEITRLVRGVLQELTTCKKARLEGRGIAASIIERLRLLHEQFGLPRLNLKPISIPLPRSRKAG